MKQLFQAVSVSFLLFNVVHVNAATVDIADDIIPEEEMLFSTPQDSIPEARFYSTARVWGKPSTEKALQRRLQIKVNKTMRITGYQHMDVYLDGELIHRYTVSTAWERNVEGKSGRVYNAYTPEGVFTPDALETKRYSNLWRVNLKYVIRFSGGVWIHATTTDHYKELGAPASGGCVRMHEEDAAELFDLASRVGQHEVAIEVLPEEKGEFQSRPKIAPGRVVVRVPRAT